jgi:hypothetical protein
MTETELSPLEKRALKTYRREGAIWGCDGAHTLETQGGTFMVVTRWGYRIAVYAAGANGSLRRVWHWPGQWLDFLVANLPLGDGVKGGAETFMGIGFFVSIHLYKATFEWLCFVSLFLQT